MRKDFLFKYKYSHNIILSSNMNTHKVIIWQGQRTCDNQVQHNIFDNKP